MWFSSMQLYAIRDALRGDSVIDLVLIYFTQGHEDGRGPIHKIISHPLDYAYTRELGFFLPPTRLVLSFP